VPAEQVLLPVAVAAEPVAELAEPVEPAAAEPAVLQRGPVHRCRRQQPYFHLVYLEICCLPYIYFFKFF
jgi:hypothetical protein